MMWFTFVIVVFAAHRITRFWTFDKLYIISVPRKAFVRRWARFDDAPKEDRNATVASVEDDDPSKKTNWFMASLAYLWECDWCTGVWASGLVTWAAVQYVEFPLPWPFIALASSSLVGFLAQAEKREYDPD